MFTYLRRMSGDRDVARDLAQETFLRAFRGAARFPTGVTSDAWILGIARNVFLEWLRSHRREVVSEHPGEPARGPVDDDTTRLDVERTLASLEREHREVLVLRFSLGLPGDEVAAILGIKHDAVRQRVARAKDAFRNVWGER